MQQQQQQQQQQELGDSLQARAYDYGAPAWYPGGAVGPLKPPRAQLSRRRLNLYAIFLILLLPYGLFVGAYALAAFQIHYFHTGLFYALLACGFAIILIFGCFAVQAAWKRKVLGDAADPSWLAFLFWSLVLAWAVGLLAGQRNFSTNMQDYYDLTSLADYEDVSPVQVRGGDVLDAGTLTFVNGTRLDLKYATGYTQGTTYCVAPVALSGAAPLAFYDFWAVGTGCCGNDGQDYRCGGYHDDAFNQPPDHISGVRIVNDAELLFYRLAVERAEASHKIQTKSPIFVRYAKHPLETRNAMANEGYDSQYTWYIGYFVFQLVLVLVAVRAIGGRFFNESLW